ncbi:MAG: DUF1684 domain-containing protein [Bacteroidales bacterium]|jgi:uncharacterized protein (DUF1684 family)|nr:DUF1684 domain-containing protein [Bacteroidales bacterium]
MKKHFFLLPITILLFVTSCSQKEAIVSDWDSYISDYEAWQHTRLERLKAENGWLNLAGLLWLEEGENTIGSDQSNSVVFPKNFPPYAGKIILKDGVTTLIPIEEAKILVDSILAPEMKLNHDQEKNTTLMELGQFRWFVIKRGDKYAIRLRDLEHPRIAALDHIPSYPFDKNWVVEAEYITFDSVRTIEVPTAIEGFTEFYKVPGELVFKVKGKKQTLLPFKSGKGFFLIVGDATNGMETYGAGRFLYIEKVDGNKVIIDFNRAYNPPCAFSPFATCPLPPVENLLDIEIEAGEKGVHLK